MKTARCVAISASLNPDTYIYKILPISTELVSISSDDSLRVLDPPTLEVYGSVHGVHDGVTCLSGFRDRLFLTAGRDGLVKCMDLRTRSTAFELSEGRWITQLAWGMSEPLTKQRVTEKKATILSTACQEHLVATGTELKDSQATITVW